MKRPRQTAVSRARALFVLGVWLAASACDAKKPVETPEKVVPQVASLGNAAASVTAPLAGSSVVDDDADHDGHRDHPGRALPAGSYNRRLNPDAVERVTTVRVLAHVGSVFIRKQGAHWVTGGAAGCTVPPARIARALANLTALEYSAAADSVPLGTPVVMQIVVLMGDELALSLDVVEQAREGDLIRLTDDSTHRVRGLEPHVWTTDPATWCADL